jgi:hypothetical protein
MPTTWSPAKYSHAKEFGSVRFTDPQGRHFGTLDFQDGSIQTNGVNGVTNEQVIDALIERLEALNAPPFVCLENEQAIANLRKALRWLESRTDSRIARGVEGSTTP